MSKTIAIDSLDRFVYGRSPRPVITKRGLALGTGMVFPEVNFTLPAMNITTETWPQVIAHYTEMADSVIRRAIELETPQLQIEFETLPEMTLNPAWGLEINRLLADKLIEAQEKHGVKTALRFTPNDIREFSRPPVMRSGVYWDNMLAVFAKAGEAGADFLSIESTGGKELNDEALINADLPGVVFALGVLGCRDMEFLWKHMVAACRENGVIPAGDSACGFGNTAMVLAEKKMIPKIFAAVVRVATVPRTLVALEQGATGPCKDCAYEGVYIKAITGTPVALEGKTAACAHLSPIGNIAAAVCDCWSNESVQNVQLLSGKAPEVSAEQLIYDCRLMNTAARRSCEDALRLRDWLVESDAPLDPQAYVLHPEIVLRISKKIVQGGTAYERTRIAVQAALEELRKGADEKAYYLDPREERWLERMEMSVEDDIPETEAEMIAQYAPLVDRSKCSLKEYGVDA
ncbi:MAG: methyltransferase MtaB domain-containing protein [Kiritimatiellales bacterium]